MGKQKSIVLVTVDCLRADHVGFMGYPRRVTPFLDTLAKDCVVFSDAIVAGVPTYYSFPGILASRYPLGLGRDVMGIAPNEPTIASALQDAGCATAAFLAGNPYLTPRFGYEQGFDKFEDSLDAALPGGSAVPKPFDNKGLSSVNRCIAALSRRTSATSAAYNEVYFWYGYWLSTRQSRSLDELRRFPAANVMVDQASAWLSGLGDQRFFLWIHLMDPHNPYYPPQEALSALGDSSMTARRARLINALWSRDDIGAQRLERYREQVFSLYDAGVYWADKQISRLVEILQQLGRWDETVLAVTGDHGEEFMEHGACYHAPMSLPESLIHVPLLLRSPEIPGGRISQSPFSLIHLAPTLLEAAGVAVPDSFKGRSYWTQISAGTLPSEPAIAELVAMEGNPLQRDDRMRPRVLAIRDSRYKLVIGFKESTDSLYDLQNDPGEKSPLPIGTLIRERVQLLQVARTHLVKSRQDRNAEFALGARLREIKQTLGAKHGQAAAPTVAG